LPEYNTEIPYLFVFLCLDTNDCSNGYKISLPIFVNRLNWNMKKALIIFGIIILLGLSIAWLFIPGKLQVAASVSYLANSRGVFDFLSIDSNWKKWWPGRTSTKAGNKTSYNFSGYDFAVDKILYQAYEIKMSKKDENDSALMKIILLSNDSTRIDLATEINAGANPFKRISSYFKAKRIEKIFDSIIESVVSYTKDVKNIYGFNIRNEKVQMEYLLSANRELTHYPSTKDVYSLIEKIRAYLKTTDAEEEFSPMLNIETNDSSHYFVRIGVPINKKVPGTGSISIKRMLKNGNILVAEVTGGRNTIEFALKQFEKYISDYQRSIVAIPFQSLETDRRQVTDSTKWTTKIYYPVI